MPIKLKVVLGKWRCRSPIFCSSASAAITITLSCPSASYSSFHDDKCGPFENLLFIHSIKTTEPPLLPYWVSCKLIGLLFKVWLPSVVWFTVVTADEVFVFMHIFPALLLPTKCRRPWMAWKVKYGDVADSVGKVKCALVYDKLRIFYSTINAWFYRILLYLFLLH